MQRRASQHRVSIKMITSATSCSHPKLTKCMPITHTNCSPLDRNNSNANLSRTQAPLRPSPQLTPKSVSLTCHNIHSRIPNSTSTARSLDLSMDRVSEWAISLIPSKWTKNSKTNLCRDWVASLTLTWAKRREQDLDTEHRNSSNFTVRRRGRRWRVWSTSRNRTTASMSKIAINQVIVSLGSRRLASTRALWSKFASKNRKTFRSSLMKLVLVICGRTSRARGWLCTCWRTWARSSWWYTRMTSSKRRSWGLSCLSRMRTRRTWRVC